MRAMFLRAGLVSLALLLVSRVLGLLRESVQAATLGATGLGDVAILMLTLPDLLTGILAAGALSYVLLPLWARQSLPAQARTQARLVRALLFMGLLAGAWMALAPQSIVQLLAPGLSAQGRSAAHTALWWSAAAMPLALVAALWTTRLQHLRDFTGMYGANLVVNSTVIGALVLIALDMGLAGISSLSLLGTGLVAGMGLRLGWLRWRLDQDTAPAHPDGDTPDNSTAGWPRSPVWLWALASAGLPLALPLLARSLTSSTGEGALTTFNYAWKLVELPLVLAIQLVASLAFPGIAKAFSDQGTAHPREQQHRALRSAFVLAWVLACAAAAALAGMGPSLAQLLFGWGRMTPEAVAQVGAWGQIGAWSLLPQALLAVLLTLMASTGRLRGAVMAYLGALGLLAALGWAALRAGNDDGSQIMWALNAALTAAAVALWIRERDFLRGVLGPRDLLPAAVAALLLAGATSTLSVPGRLPGLAAAMALAALVLGTAWVSTPSLRQALQRSIH
jgi:putative peptidoglycan lipid II flippase